jgi:hypothetical protein
MLAAESELEVAGRSQLRSVMRLGHPEHPDLARDGAAAEGEGSSDAVEVPITEWCCERSRPRLLTAEEVAFAVDLVAA